MALMGYTPEDDSVTTAKIKKTLDRGFPVILAPPGFKFTQPIPAPWGVIYLSEPIEDNDWVTIIE